MQVDRVLCLCAMLLATTCAVISGASLVCTFPDHVKGASPGAGYECYEFSTTHKDHPCACPIPAEVTDYCSNALPIDGDTVIYETGCTDIVQNTCNDTPAETPCGPAVWNCTAANCYQDPQEAPEGGWDCIWTSKTGYCTEKFGCLYTGA